MKKFFPFLFILLMATNQAIHGQTKSPATALSSFLHDPDFAHALIGFKVVDLNTGKTLITHNPDAGLAPASSQKIITSATAFALLGKDYRYKTNIGYKGEIKDGVLYGDLIIKGAGDPTLGSDRFSNTTPDVIFQEIMKALNQKGIQRIEGHVLVDQAIFKGEIIPDGWIWQDIGNYYGAGAHALNWRENQFSLFLKSGNQIGQPVEIIGTEPTFIPSLSFISEVKSAKAGSGDNAYIYFPTVGGVGHLRGTIPINQTNFRLKGALPEPGQLLAMTLEAKLKGKSVEEIAQAYPKSQSSDFKNVENIVSVVSPTLDSINDRFLKKSINLYGEALLKTLGAEKGKEGSTEAGLQVVKEFWATKGLDAYALGIVDGSGLSPQNRVTADDLVQVLLYARTQPWFKAYFAGFPTIHGIRMKSGTINGTVSYTGIMSGSRGDFVFAIIVNNHNGSAAATRRKIWSLLDQIKGD